MALQAVLRTVYIFLACVKQPQTGQTEVIWTERNCPRFECGKWIQNLVFSVDSLTF